MSEIKAGSTDQSMYFVLLDVTTGEPVTGLTITALDATYTRTRATAVKNDLTALSAANDAHADNQAIQVDATNAPGLYRVDFPDAAFASGVAGVVLSINGAAIKPAHKEFALVVNTAEDVIADTNDIQANLALVKEITDKLDTTLDPATGSPGEYAFTADALRNTPTAPSASAIADEVQTRTIAAVTTVNGFAADSITAAALAADAGTELGSAVWASATRTLTAIDEDSTTLDLDATIRAAVGLAAADLDTQLAALPTATENADALLNRDMSSVSDTNARSPLNALRFIRNKWDVAAGTLTVKKEDDTTTAWTASVSTSAGAEPIIGNDPA
jgi:hypothetical protein